MPNITDDDIKRLVDGMYPVAANHGKREEIRNLIREGIVLAQEFDGPPEALIRNSESKSLDLRRSCKDLRRESRITYQSRPPDVESIIPTQDPTIACLARFAECWDLCDRDDFEVHDEDAEQWPPVPATVLEKGAPSPEGTPNFWIRVSGEYASWFPTQARDGMEVLLRIGEEQFHADLRFVEANNYLQIYPSLQSSEGADRLGRVLSLAGYNAGDLIELYVINNVIRVRLSPE